MRELARLAIPTHTDKAAELELPTKPPDKAANLELPTKPPDKFDALELPANPLDDFSKPRHPKDPPERDQRDSSTDWWSIYFSPGDVCSHTKVLSGA